MEYVGGWVGGCSEGMTVLASWTWVKAPLLLPPRPSVLTGALSEIKIKVSCRWLPNLQHPPDK